MNITGSIKEVRAQVKEWRRQGVTVGLVIVVAIHNTVGLAISLATANFAANPLATLPGAVFSVWHNISGIVYAGIRNRKRTDAAERGKVRPAM